MNAVVVDVSPVCSFQRLALEDPQLLFTRIATLASSSTEKVNHKNNVDPEKWIPIELSQSFTKVEPLLLVLGI
jgi:hypothetical protein